MSHIPDQTRQRINRQMNRRRRGPRRDPRSHDKKNKDLTLEDRLHKIQCEKVARQFRASGNVLWAKHWELYADHPEYPCPPNYHSRPLESVLVRDSSSTRNATQIYTGTLYDELFHPVNGDEEYQKKLGKVKDPKYQGIKGGIQAGCRLNDDRRNECTIRELQDPEFLDVRGYPHRLMVIKNALVRKFPHVYRKTNHVM